MKSIVLHLASILLVIVVASCIKEVNVYEVVDSESYSLVLQDSKNNISTDNNITDSVGNVLRVGLSLPSPQQIDSIKVTVFSFQNNRDSVFVLKNFSSDQDTIWSEIVFLTPGKRDFEVAAYLKNADSISIAGSITIYTKVVSAQIEPSNLVRQLGTEAVFNVIAKGDAPFTYKWFHDSISLAGDTTKTLTLTNIQFSDSGAYTNVVHDKWGNKTTTLAARLRVVTPTGITNTKPSLVVHGFTTILATESCSLVVSAIDPDSGQTFAYSVLKAPEGFSFTNNSFLWTPPPWYLGADSIKTDTVIFVVSDDGQPVESDTQIVPITVQKIMQGPGKVTGISGIARVNGNFVFAWNKSRFATEYQIYRAKDSTKLEKYQIVKDTLFSNSIKDTVFYYQVVAANSQGISLPSKKIISTSVNAAPVWAHTSFKVDVVENQSVSISLADSISDSNGDKISLSIVDGNPTLDSLVGSVWSYKAGYSDSGTYTIKIHATDSIASPVVLSILLHVIDANRPPEFMANKPSNAYGIVEKSNLLFPVKIVDPDSNTTSVSIESTTLPRPTTVTISNDTLRWMSLAGDTGIYEVVLRATDGLVSISKTVAIFINKNLPAPQIPTLITPINTSASQSIHPDLIWNSTVFASSYHLQVSTSAGFETVYFQDSTLSVTTKNMANLEYGKQYFWRVRAKNSSGTSSWSDVWTFKTIKQFTLSINSINGAVTKLPNDASFDSGSVVTLTPVPVAGYQFVGWGGDLSGITNPASITMSAAKNITAIFSRIPYPLSITAVNGTVTRSPSNTEYDSGTVVTLTPVAAMGYRFSGWSGDLTGAANPATLFMNSAKSLTANFIRVTYGLTLTAVNGTVTKSPNNTVYDSGAVVTITPQGAAGYRFSHWSGDQAGSANPLLLSMNATKNITANFTKGTFSLSLNALNGTVLKSPDLAAYDSGAVVTLVPQGAAGYRFSGWSGDLSGAVSPQTITMNGSKTVTANFAKVSFALTVNATNGTVAKAPLLAGYDSGAVVVLTPQALPGYRFSGWSGDLSGTANPATITMNTAKTLTAHFVKVFSLEITALNGSVGKTPNNALYDSGAVVTLTAQPAMGYQFSTWSGNLTGSVNPQTITMNGAKSVTANFTKVTYLLTITATNGTVTKLPNNTVYDSGSIVTLTPVPTIGYRFSGWSGALSGMANPASLIMNSVKSVTATFTKVAYPLTINAINGTVIRSPNQDSYDSGTVVTLTASPVMGYRFSGWSGDLSGMTSPTTITINSPKNITAGFVRSQFVINANTSADVGVVTGTIIRIPTQPMYDSGATVTLMAPTDTRYQFFNWTMGGTIIGTANSIDVKVSSDLFVIANYKIKTCSLTVVNSPLAGGSVSTSPLGPINCGNTMNITATPTTGYRFVNWSGAVGVNGSTVSSTTILLDVNKTVTANFELIPYTISFDAQNGSSPTTQQVSYGNTATIPALPSRTGYTFKGWYTEQACINLWDFATPITQSRTLYAKWEGVTSQVTFDPQNGLSTTVVNVVYPTTTINPLPTNPVKSGYTFTGWNFNADGSGAVFTSATSVTNNMTIYAQWTIQDADKNTYTEITIGSQTWIVENIKTTKYADGTDIPNVTDATDWTSQSKHAYAWYENMGVDVTPYGAYYNWHVIETGVPLIVGWHVPTDSEWEKLQKFLNRAGATFPAQNSGFRSSSDGSFVSAGSYGYAWSATDLGGKWANRWEFNFDDATGVTSNFNSSPDVYSGGAAIRLIKD